jgi:hypothetical protein
MPVIELQNLRNKYPQYKDIDDMTLATKLASKYPQYADLVDKVKGESLQKVKPDMLDILAGKTPEQLKQEGIDLYRGGSKTKGDIALAESALLSTAKEAAGFPLEMANLAGFGLPRAALKASGTDFPEQTSIPGKIGRGVGGFLGFMKGPGALNLKTASAVSKILPAATKPIFNKIVSQGVAGAVTGAAITPEGEDIVNLPERGKQAAISGIIQGALPVAGKVIKKGMEGVRKGGAFLSGIEQDTLNEVSQKGFRKVLQQKYYNKKMPEVIQLRIENNLSNLEDAAGKKYDQLTAPLRQTPFDMAQLRGEVAKLATKAKINPFNPEGMPKIDQEIIDGIVNKAQVKNLGDALDLRRFLDDKIYSPRGELETSFGKKIRDVLNKELHKNKMLEQTDKDWAGLKSSLKEGKKVIGETGEKFLARFSTLTSKQKDLLVRLEKEIGGEPFMEDLTNWSLAKQFTSKASPSGSIGGLISKVSKPMFRGYLRTGETIKENAQPLFTGGKQALIKLTR